jgi:pimeloyl-ACP methyl ester carboxylesterase
VCRCPCLANWHALGRTSSYCRPVRVRLGVLLAAVGGISALGVGEAAAALEFCDRAANGRSCATLTVPLDRGGAVPGTVKLRIERQKAKRAVRPPLFLIAASGQSATDAFDSELVEDIVGTEARSRDIVVMDLRGTGRSGALDCPALQGRSPKPAVAAVAACAAKLGARRDFYSSVDVADDIDAVRAALGAERIAIYGASYGTYVAQAYARRYPARVDRLVLDSPVGPTGLDALERSSLMAAPAALQGICGKRACRRFMRDPGAVLTRLAERLERRPLTGYVVNRFGKRRRATIDGRGLLELAAAYPLVSGTLPAAVAAAVRGDSAPLLRAHADLFRLFRVAFGATPARDSSVATAVATHCSDTAFPWSRATPLEARRASAAAIADSLPADVFAPFSRQTALRGDTLESCLGWPSSSRSVPSAGPLPDVPALLLAGGASIDSPVAEARALQMLLPRSELIVVPDVAQGLIEWGGDCPGRAVRRFLAGGEAGRCGRFDPDVAGSIPSPPPVSLGQLRTTGAPGRPGRTVTAVQRTLVEAFQTLFLTSLLDLAVSDGRVEPGSVTRAGALRGGSYVGTVQGFALRKASFVPGVRVSGALRAPVPGRLRGSFEVGGRAAERGRLRLRGEVLRGTIGGRPVRVPFSLAELAFGISSRVASTAVESARAGRLLSLPVSSR